MSAMKAKDVDLSKLTITAPKTLNNGGKMMFVNYGGGINKLYLHTPETELPFDASYFADDDNSGKYSVKISLNNIESDQKVKEFHDKLVEMDNLLIEKACENSQSWFKKAKMSRDAVEALYTPMVKVSVDQETGEPNGKYPPGCGFKIVKKDGKFPEFSIYDNQKPPTVFDVNHETESPVSIERLLVKNALVKCVLRCNGVWIANGKFGCTWRAEQVRIKTPEGGLNDFAIMSDSEDEDSGVDPKVIVEDSSDEEVEEQVQKKEEKPKKVRKVRVKKESA
tara:strand:- start:109 stop:948 length:840 start_codon:yes stop_codon:yes gene_type:complete